MKIKIILLMLLMSCGSVKEVEIKNNYLLSKKILKRIYGDKKVNLNVYTLKVNKETLNRNLRLISLIPETAFNWYKDFEDYEKISVKQFTKWNEKSIYIKNINLSFPITKKKYLDEYEKLKSLGNLNDEELYLKKMEFWSSENKIYKITSISNAFHNVNKSKAIIFTSTIKSSYTSWAFEKHHDEWIFKEKRDILLY